MSDLKEKEEKLVIVSTQNNGKTRNNNIERMMRDVPDVADKIVPVLRVQAEKGNRNNDDTTIEYGVLHNAFGWGAGQTNDRLHVLSVFCTVNNLPQLNHLVVSKKTGVAGDHSTSSGSVSERLDEQKLIANINWATIDMSREALRLALIKQAEFV